MVDAVKLVLALLAFKGNDDFHRTPRVLFFDPVNYAGKDAGVVEVLRVVWCKITEAKRPA